MIERTAAKTLSRLASQFPVVGITGPRQSGKSTLAKMVFPHKKYISFDDKNMRELAMSAPSDFLNAFPDGAVIDEAQKVPDIFDAVKYNVDNTTYKPGKFILTGSYQFRLRENMTDSLAGRAAFLRLLPLSIAEINSANLLKKSPYEHIFTGEYPSLYDQRKHFLVFDWLERYIDTYLDLDIQNHITPANLSAFKKFLKYCATYSGQILSMENIAANVGVSSPTIKTWLSLLENSFIIYLLRPSTNNLGKTLTKSPKLYFLDSGLLCHLLQINSPEDLILSPYRGAVVETFAVAELLKKRLNDGQTPNIFYYRDKKGFEIDIIAEWQKTHAIEIKSTTTSEKKLSANVRKYLTLRADNCQGIVYYLGDLSCTINDINYIGWQHWSELEQ